MMLTRLLLSFLLLFCAAGPSFAAGEAKAKASKKKAPKPYDYERSKYKSRELTEGEQRHYRFNERGEPVLPAEKKKKSAPVEKKKGSASSEAKEPAAKACADDKPCAGAEDAEAL